MVYFVWRSFYGMRIDSGEKAPTQGAKPPVAEAHPAE
jgi:hypothetical protein